jgi:hypothetical protein
MTEDQLEQETLIPRLISSQLRFPAKLDNQGLITT